MNRHLVIALAFASWCASGSVGRGQQTDVIPPRFQSIAKSDRFKLVRILGTPELHPAFTPTTAFSADGKRAVYVEDLSTGGDDDKPVFRSRLVVWDVAAKSWPREIDIVGRNVTALDLSADGKTALLSGLTYGANAKDWHPYLSLWNLDTGKEVRTVLTPEERPILSVALAPDGHSALAGTRENLKRWDLKTGKASQVYGEPDKTSATCLAYLPGGKRFLAGFHGGEVRLFDIDKEKHLRGFKAKGEHEFVWHLAVAADGKRFASADFQSSVSLWETDTGKELGTLRLDKRTLEEVITGIALDADGKTVYSVWGKAAPDADDFACAKIYAWDAAANKVLWSSVAGYRGRVPMFIKEDTLQIGGGPNVFELWAIKNGRWRARFGGHKSQVNAVAATANGKLLSGGLQGIQMIWREGELVQQWKSHSGAITALAVDREAKTWLSAGSREIGYQSPDAIGRLFATKHTGTITSLAVSANGNLVTSGSNDRSVRTRLLPDGMEIAVLTGHAEGVNAVAISPDERWIASGSDDTTIRVWPVKDGKLDADRDVIVLEDHKKPVTCLAFSADGKSLISGSQDQTLIVWDTAKGKRVRTLTGHKNWITSITLVDEKTALTTCDDLTVCWWDLESGKELDRIDFGAVGDCPRCLTRRGDRIFVGTASWMIFEFQILPAGKSKSGAGSSK